MSSHPLLVEGELVGKALRSRRVGVFAVAALTLALVPTAASAQGSDDYAATVLADGPLAYWRLGESTGTHVADSSGNGHHGSAEPGVTFASAGLTDFTDDSSISTTGGSRVTVPGFEKGSVGYTVEYWIRLNQAPFDYHNIVGDGESGVDFYLMNYLTREARVRPHFGADYGLESTTVLNVGQVYHVVTTWDHSTGQGIIYIDGVVDTSISGQLAGPDSGTTDNAVFLGRDNREPGLDFDLDEVAIYDRALSAAEISEHYLAAVDSDGDNVADGFDAFPASDLTQSVAIGSCSTTVANHLFDTGATFNDLITAAAAAAPNHGSFVSSVTKLAKQWKRAGLISGKDKGRITRCAARSGIGN